MVGTAKGVAIVRARVCLHHVPACTVERPTRSSTLVYRRVLAGWCTRQCWGCHAVDDGVYGATS